MRSIESLEALKFKIVEECDTVQGEGLYAGRPTHFIRLMGCNLDCAWCDSNRGIPDPTKNDYHGPIEISVDDHLLGMSTGSPHFCFTGGEPLNYSKEVAYWLAKVAYYWWYGLDELPEIQSVTIETGGGRSVRTFRKLLNYFLFNLISDGRQTVVSEGALDFLKKVSVCVDYKLKSTGEGAHGKMVMDNFSEEVLGKYDSVKLVIFDQEDLQEALGVLADQNYFWYTNVFLSPCWDGDLALFQGRARMVGDAVKKLIPYHPTVGISLQQHKIIGMK